MTGINPPAQIAPEEATSAEGKAAKLDLAAELACRFGEVRLKVTGASMLPSLWPGDILTVRRRSVADLVPGQIVLCYRNQAFVAHRLVGKRGRSLITRGDSLPYYDRPFREDEVLGQVVGVLRHGRSIDPSPTWRLRAASWILRHSELCARVLLHLRSIAMALRATKKDEGAAQARI